jgi:SSS family solute:Na+ symporter
MVFLGIVMMPFYYGSKVRSVPEYLRLRFNVSSHVFNSITFAIGTILIAGVNLYALALVLKLLLGWPIILGIVVAAGIVLAYIVLGGLSSAIYNEVLQFFLIVAGFVPLVYLGLKDVGGWEGIRATLPAAMVHSWRGMGSAETNPMGVDVLGVSLGLGFVLSFGYWCTDFLVVQRAMAADSMTAARRTPLIAAIPKSLFPFLVIMPGLIALAAQPAAQQPTASLFSTPTIGAPAQAQATGAGIIPFKVSDTTGEIVRDGEGRPQLDYDLAVPVMLLHYFPTGLLGLGLTALLASFMSGMAGNVTAFNTVWTYDIYQAYIRPKAPDAHYLWMGRMATVFGIAASVATAYVAAQFNNIMDILQLVFAFVNAPLLATFLLGMFWKRTTGHGAFSGLLAGTTAAAIHHMSTLAAGDLPGIKGGLLGVAHTYHSEMAQNFWTAIFAWTVCFVVTVAVSLATRPHPEESLRGLVYSLTERPRDTGQPWYGRPSVLAVCVLTLTVLLNVIFF